MKIVSEILFIVSNGLMIPVILLLLYFLVKAIWILLGLYGQIKVQREISSTLKALVRDYSDECIKDTQIKLQATGESIVSEYLKRIIEHKHDSRYCEHELADFQVETQRILAKYRMLVKFGPMLGLMGTLIPMGPALVGLGIGDISSMAYNMQVAFATTVIGMLVSGIGLCALQLNQRYYAGYLNDLEFLTSKITAL
ncbi:MAG: MotA/TolQ/ExbB proton channel family protein [bacterium]|nr:MotA/TolQ/ExbB proton channel family protein [bacterium]MDY2650843.1 MotA/TolQ/ExbB proton channel family protein [Candidatus Egerieousia sp.]